MKYPVDITNELFEMSARLSLLAASITHRLGGKIDGSRSSPVLKGLDLEMTIGAKNASTIVNVSGVEAPPVIKLPTLPSAGHHEKRRETRYPTNDPAQVQVLPIDGTRRPATVLDVSRSGLRLELHAPAVRGVQVKVTLSEQVVIFGEVRYCRRAGDVFHAGVLIQDVVYSRPCVGTHVHDDDLSLYLVGKGLSASEVIKFREHLILCESCRIRLNEMDAMLNPSKKRLAHQSKR